MSDFPQAPPAVMLSEPEFEEARALAEKMLMLCAETNPRISVVVAAMSMATVSLHAVAPVRRFDLMAMQMIEQHAESAAKFLADAGRAVTPS